MASSYKTVHYISLPLESASIKYDDLSEFQRKNLKNNYKSSEKLITHLDYDKNCYISFEMYDIDDFFRS